jgi:hypothetical protein
VSRRQAGSKHLLQSTMSMPFPDEPFSRRVEVVAYCKTWLARAARNVRYALLFRD